MKNIIKQTKNNKTHFITRDEAKKILMLEMLSTWQPLAALAIRCGLTNESAFRLLELLEKDGKIISSSFRLNGKSKSRAYKIIEYFKIMNVMIPLQNENLDLCTHTDKRRARHWRSR